MPILEKSGIWLLCCVWWGTTQLFSAEAQHFLLWQHLRVVCNGVQTENVRPIGDFSNNPGNRYGFKQSGPIICNVNFALFYDCSVAKSCDSFETP